MIASVLFICTANSARSQLAERLLRRRLGAAVRVASAGIAPTAVHPLTLTALDEIGIDAGGATADQIERYLDDRWDYVITVCDSAAERCPVFPGGGQRLHWSFADPAAVRGTDAQRLDAFRHTRDAIAERIVSFVATLEAVEG